MTICLLYNNYYACAMKNVHYAHENRHDGWMGGCDKLRPVMDPEQRGGGDACTCMLPECMDWLIMPSLHSDVA